MMKTIITGVTAMSLSMLTTIPSSATPADESAIRTIVESVATFADTANFDALEDLYAEEVAVDYSSLTGAAAEVKSARALMSEWAGILPGFDRTRHDISDIEVRLNGTSALASASVTADHYIGDLFWQVSGTYDYELVSEEDGWKITSHTFMVSGEKGTRDVFALAMEAAAQNPPAYIIRQQTKQAVLDFLTALEEKDMGKFASVWADDAVQDMPYSPEGFPKRVSGRDNLIAHYAAWPENSGAADFTSELVFYPTVDPQTVFVEFKGAVEIVPTGRDYNQTYGGLFHVEHAKITLFREYYNPDVFRYAFGLDEGGSFHRD